jgi:cyclopropane fatty-acyl-phospholipid synthase-like methyltransferase
LSAPWWDEAYTGDEPAPWDIGRPQAAFVRLAENGRLSGQVLDAGCGTGEHVLLAAANGAADPLGIDVSPTAISRARAKAAERGLTARFEVGDALQLGSLGASVDTIIDSGLFHIFGDEDRSRYVASLSAAARQGGYLYLMCFSDRQPGEDGPRRVREEELRASFSDGWSVESIAPDKFTVGSHFSSGAAEAWLAVIRRGEPSGR